MLVPAGETPAAPAPPRGAVECDPGRLRGHAPARAGGVDEQRGGLRGPVRDAGARPSGAREQQGGVVRAQGALGAQARAAVEQGLSRQVELQGRAVAAQRDGDARVGPLGVHVRAQAGLVGQPVAQGVLRTQGDVARVAKLVVGAARADRHRRAAPQHALPGHAVHAVVQVVGVAAGEARDDGEHAARQARPQADALRVDGLPLEGDASLERADAPDAEGAQLVGEGALEALRAAGEEFHGYVLVGRDRVSVHLTRMRGRGARARGA